MKKLLIVLISFQVHASGVREKSHQLELQGESKQTLEDESIQQLKNYCPGSDDLMKCRLKVENDCENEVSNKSCKIWNRINQTFNLSAVKRKRPVEKADVKLPKPEPFLMDCDGNHDDLKRLPSSVPVVMKKIKIIRGTVNLSRYSDQSLIEEGNKPETLPELRARDKELEGLKDKINTKEIPIHCLRDTDCVIQGFGDHGCGGVEGHFSYSKLDGKMPDIISEVLRFNKLEDEMNEKVRGFASTCSIYPIPEAGVCAKNVCENP